MTKTAIVTGAAGNLGQAVVKKFISEGYFVIGTILPTEQEQHGFSSTSFEAVAVDLVQEEKAKQFVESIINKYGTVDAAVLTAGGFAMGSITTTTAADILQQYKLNFETAYNIAQPLFAHMKQQQSGRIFFIGSKPGLSAANSEGMVAYSLGKSLLFRLAELMNHEAKGTDVVTSVLVPSTIDTPQNRKAMPDADFSKWVLPEAIADVIAFHCSQAASIIREPVIKVYGSS
ncbi:MAG TPA: SDR family NAD(P)-dependent oxidoreductase [Ferruginibacter sp.]|nr:SDR family NAD(P)-dependent oxidoreductase [Ferruginibacter sp.]HMP20833.1 SDR family NAD(P)-dependent oxidoreductase [Ferruginibacter sp.]